MFSRVIIALALVLLVGVVGAATNCPYGYYLQTQRGSYPDGCLPCPAGTTGKFGVFDNSEPSVEALLSGGTCLTCPGKNGLV